MGRLKIIGLLASWTLRADDTRVSVLYAAHRPPQIQERVAQCGGRHQGACCLPPQPHQSLKTTASHVIYVLSFQRCATEPPSPTPGLLSCLAGKILAGARARLSRKACPGKNTHIPLDAQARGAPEADDTQAVGMCGDVGGMLAAGNAYAAPLNGLRPKPIAGLPLSQSRRQISATPSRPSHRRQPPSPSLPPATILPSLPFLLNPRVCVSLSPSGEIVCNPFSPS